MTAAMPEFAETTFEEPRGPQPPAEPQWRPMPIAFTGSGSEYFRIWIVNLLLSVLTLSLYMPYARARRLRYFHGNTLVDGQALGFHGSGHAMLRGHLLVLVFGALYAGAGHFSPLAAGVAGLALALLWPALWQSSLRFRLANTSWRGLRLRFTGSVGDAYRCLWPGLVPVGLFLLLSGLRGMGEDDAEAAAPLVGAWADAAVGLCLLLLVATAPVLLARLKRYQHGHYHFAGDTTRLDASNGDFYRLWMRGGGVSLLGLGALMAVGAALFFLLPAARSGGSAPWQGVVFGVVAGLGYLALVFGVQAWYAARLQNLVWGRTASARLRFGSSLRARDLALLNLKNLLLTLVTLGLYRPFAVVAATRLRLSAVTLQAQGPVDTWVARAVGSGGDAAGDAAGDLLGVDLGL